MDTPPLTAVVSNFLRRWDAERPTTLGQYGSEGRRSISCMSGVSWLVQETGLSDRTIQRIAAGQRKTTEFHVADKIVHALGMEHLFHNELTVYPNPRAPRSIRAQCCSAPRDGLTGVG